MNTRLIRELRSTEGSYLLFGHRRCGLSTLLRDVSEDNDNAVLVASGQPKQGVIGFHDLATMPDRELLHTLMGKTLVMDVFDLPNILPYMSKLTHVANNIIVGVTGRPTLKELNLYLAQGFNVKRLPNIVTDKQLLKLSREVSTDYYSREFIMDFKESE